MTTITSTQPSLTGIASREEASESKESIFKLDPGQSDAAKKIIEQKIVTETDRSDAGILKPYLAEPVALFKVKEEKNDQKSYEQLMASLLELLGQKALDELHSRAEIYIQFSKRMGSASQETLNLVAAEQGKLEEAETALKRAQENLTESRQKTQTLKGELSTAEETLAQLKLEKQQAIDNADKKNSADDTVSQKGTDKDDSKGVIDALSSNIAKTESQIAGLKEKINQENKSQTELDKTISQTAGSLKQAGETLKNSLDYLEQLNKNAAAAQTIINGGKSQAHTAALLMTQIIALMGESNEESMKTNIEFSRKVQEAQQEKLRLDAEEVEAQQRKAQEMQETMGCIGKILGAIITAVSVAAAVFTGGASLAIAAVGLALMVADEIYQKVTGNDSFMAAAMKPLMEHIIMPMIQAIADAIGSVLKKFGVNSELSAIISTVIAAVAFVVMLIGAAVAVKNLPVGKLASAASKMLGETFKGMMKSATSTVNNMVNQLTKPLTKVLNQFLGDAVKGKQIANHLQLASDVITASKTGVESSGSIASGVFQKKAEEAMAQITLLLSDSKMMQRFEKQITEAFSATIERTNQMLMNASDMANADLATGRAILARARV